MACNSTSIPNPDIDGIGIRVSIYAQALLVLIPAILRPIAAIGHGEALPDMPDILKQAFAASSVIVRYCLPNR